MELTVREDESFGFARAADGEKIAIVVLTEGDTQEKLRDELAILYRG